MAVSVGSGHSDTPSSPWDPNLPQFPVRGMGDLRATAICRVRRQLAAWKLAGRHIRSCSGQRRMKCAELPVATGSSLPLVSFPYLVSLLVLISVLVPLLPSDVDNGREVYDLFFPIRSYTRDDRGYETSSRRVTPH